MPEIPENFDEAADGGLRLTTCSRSSECKGPTHYAGCACHEKGWEDKWKCAVEMAEQAEAKLALIMDVSARLNDYVRAGGMICEPTSIGDYWELGRNLGQCYCIDGQGNTLMECLLSVSRAVWHEVSSENVKVHTPLPATASDETEV